MPVSVHELLAGTVADRTVSPVIHVSPEMVADLHEPRLIISPQYVGRDRRQGPLRSQPPVTARPSTQWWAQAVIVALVTAAAVVPLTLMVAHADPAATDRGATRAQVHPAASAPASIAPSAHPAARAWRSTARAAARSAKAAAVADRRAARSARAALRTEERSARATIRATRRAEARAARAARQASRRRPTVP